MATEIEHPEISVLCCKAAAAGATASAIGCTAAYAAAMGLRAAAEVFICLIVAAACWYMLLWPLLFAASFAAILLVELLLPLLAAEP